LCWENKSAGGPHEANFLKLDCSKLKSVFGWKPVWGIATAVEKVVEWSKCYAGGGNVADCMDRQIAEFFSGNHNVSY
ncbi:MAG: CDP-glucose 4,6-dehydratase, partial [Christensenellaceae bacterium]